MGELNRRADSLRFEKRERAPIIIIIIIILNLFMILIRREAIVLRHWSAVEEC